MNGNHRDLLLVGGEWTESSGRQRIEIVSPSTEEVIGSVPSATHGDVDRAVAAARRAFDTGSWQWWPIAERAAVIARLAAELRAREEELAQLITSENGAPISMSRVGLAPPRLLEYYATLGADLELDELQPAAVGPALLRKEPVGVCALIVPWNSPQGLLFAGLAPALLAGCTVVVKPSPQTALDSYVFAEAVQAAGVPDGVINVLPAELDSSEYLVGHPGVDKIAFTGSSAVGRQIMARCAENIKRVTLELGGKSAGIVLDDADLDATIETLVRASTTHSGQACFGLTRVLASRHRVDEVAERLAAAYSALVVGDPFDTSTQVGPLVTERQRERVEGYVELGRAAGARVASGGGRPAGLERGWYVEPTVLTGVDNAMRVAREEIFGPVVCVLEYENDEQALAIANDSPYGLSGGVFSEDLDRAHALARRIRTGTVHINCFTWDYAAPHGGYKTSGLGRLWGRAGIDSYLESKTIRFARDVEPARVRSAEKYASGAVRTTT